MSELLSMPLADWLAAQPRKGGVPIDVDVLVVGSGYGGSVAALRLAQQGRQVLVVERGAEFRPGDFPGHAGHLPKYLRAHGLDGIAGNLGGVLDLRIGQGLASVVANGLGGGSLVNAGVLMRPDDDVFAQAAWPAEIRHALDRRQQAGGRPLGLDAAFDTAAAMLGGQEFVDGVRPPSLGAAPAEAPPGSQVSVLPKAQALDRMGRAMEPFLAHEPRAEPQGRPLLQVKRARVTIDLARCTRCGDCFTGCNVPGAKTTLATTYLRQARAAGAQLLTAGLVYAVAPARRGWEVQVLPAERARHAHRLADAVAAEGVVLRAQLLVIAAGTFGSTELLLRSRNLQPAFTLSPALGTRLSGNGDSLSVLADQAQPVEGTAGLRESPTREIGPTITTVLDLRGRRELEQRVVIQEGAVPAALGGIYQELLASAWTLRHLGLFRGGPRANAGSEPLAATPSLARHTQLLLAMGHDGSRGRIVWLPEMDGAVPFWPQPGGEATYRRQQALFDLAQRSSAGATHLHAPTWRAVPPAIADLAAGGLPSPAILTVHPLGGCPMGDSFRTGAVNHLGQAWREPGVAWRGLYVLDGSIVPTSLGCNPLWTITALAERAMAQLAGTHLRPDARVLQGGANGDADLHGRGGADGRAKGRAGAHPMPMHVPPATQPPALRPAADLPPMPAAVDPAELPVLAFDLRERLELQQLAVRGALQQALGAQHAECDLALSMRAQDWLQTWRDAGHRIGNIRGRMRLAVPPPADTVAGAVADDCGTQRGWQPPATARLAYTVSAGSIALFTPAGPLEACFPALLRQPWRWLRRLLRLPAAFATWLLLRGVRDLREAAAERIRGDRVSLADVWRFLGQIWRMAAVLWAATDDRHVRYALELVLDPQASAPLAAGAAPPPRLFLSGGKRIGYAASPLDAARWIGHRAFAWAAQRLPRLAAWRPAWSQPPSLADLRPGLLRQMTEPTLRIDTGPGLRHLPFGIGSLAHARFGFDFQAALQRTPLQLGTGGDSVTAALAALAYPAFVARHLVRAHLLDFRQPSYSGRPVVDAASKEDVALRIDGGPVLPQEFVLEVPQGLSSSDEGVPLRQPAVRLRLWRYARQRDGRPVPPACEAGTWCGLPVRRARSVLLMHAFDMSGLTFTFKETQRNFAEHLYRAGWEVWILDSRMSPRTLAAIEPCTVDQLGLIDAPRAVDFIQQRLLQELGPGAPLQTHGFGQCMGAAALLVGLLSGRLSHGVPAPQAFRAAGGELPRMPKLAGLVTSQTHPFIVGSRTAQAKTWIPALLRDLAGRTLVPLGVRSAAVPLVESLADRLFATFPVPPGERCPGEGRLHPGVDDGCATCRRIRFLLGGMFLHRNLNQATHDALPRLFGSGSVRLFAQGAKFFVYERLVSEDGFNTWVNDAAIARHLALPLRFVHGAQNDLFDAESARRSAAQYARIHPGWAQRFGLRTRGGGRQACDVIDGYGHVDVLLGQQAMQAERPGAAPVYRRLAGLLETAWRVRDAAPAPMRAAVPALLARFPRSGPFLGPVVTAADGSRTLGLSFIVDDTGADTAQWAAALVERPGQPGTTLVPLDLRAFRVAVPARDGSHVPPAEGALVGLRVASGRIDVSGVAGAQDGLLVRCASFAATAGPPGQVAALRSSGAGHGVPAAAMPGPAAAAIAGPAVDAMPRPAVDALPVPSVDALPLPSGDPLPLPPVDALVAAVEDAVARAEALRQASDRPFPPSLSQRSRYPRHPATMRARVPGSVLVPPAADATVRIAAGCCRHPGFPFEERRRDAALRRLLALLERPDALPPQLLFMLGDQIYADRTAGLLDPLSPTERFFFRHQEAFTTVAMRKLLSRLPTACLPDDHEFTDGFPLGRPLLRRGPVPARRGDAAQARRATAQREQAAVQVARDAVHAWQSSQLPPSMAAEGWCAFDRGRVRFFALDTRSHRRRTAAGIVETLTAAARAAFSAWLEELRQQPGCLGVLATGSVLLPGLRPGADPANMGPLDTLQAAPEERAWLLAQLATALRGRFVLLSGDYHLAFAGPVCLDGMPVGAAVVAPPFHAPMLNANTRPGDLWLQERIATECGVFEVRAGEGPGPQPGSGYALLDFTPRDGRWELAVHADLVDFERGAGWREVELGRMLLGP